MAEAEVAYREGRYFVGETPLFVVAADYQYYRDRREHWRSRLELLQAGHVNTITFYVPWRHHRTDDGFDFSGTTRPNRDLQAFLGLCVELGLWAIAKPGPFVHSELNIGGLPDADALDGLLTAAICRPLPVSMTTTLHSTNPSCWVHR